MVKKLIKGLLKKKEAAPPPQQAAPEEDIPDELPPLAEDVAEGAAKAPEKPVAEAPAAPAAPEAPKEAPAAPPPAEEKPAEPPKEEAPKENVLPTGNEAPDELPSLEFEKHASSLDLRTDEEKQAAVKKEEPKAPPKTPSKDEKQNPLPEGHEGMPAEIKKAKMAKEGTPEPKSPLPKLEDFKKLSSKLEADDSLSSLEAGFFSNLLDHMKKADSTKEKLLTGDLYARMSNYWDLKKHEIKTGTTVSTEQHLESEMITVLEELKTLEFKWQRQKMALEEDLKFLEQREREIKNKTDELRRVTNELSMFKNVKPEEYFRLRNGVLLKNMHDLVDMLEIMDETTFGHHVSGRKNDFADWVKHVFADKMLGDRVRSSKSRAEMIDTLLDHPVIQLRQRKIKKRLHPAQYFFLANGVVIKSAAELSDALKAMDTKLFQKHVDLEKNDFAVWLKKVVREPELAAHIEKAHTKKEMIAALDIYL